MGNCTTGNAEYACVIYLEELMNAVDMRVRGACVNCGHAVSEHQRKPSSDGEPDQPASSDTMFEWLSKRSGYNILTNEEQVIFWTKFGGYATPLREQKLSIVQSRSLVKQVLHVLKSQTTAAMMAVGFVFDGLLPVGQDGGGKALLYQVIEASTGEVKCGKVYRADQETERTITAEIEGSAAVHQDGHSQFIVRYETVLPFEHQTSPSKKMIVLIMPLFQLSLAAVLEAFKGNRLPLNMFLKVTACVLGAGSRFHQLGLSHCDFKPENIMTTGSTFIVIDLGAVCRYGEPAKEYTRGYFLDAPVHKVASIFDLNCAAVTLARCCIPDFTVASGMTRAGLERITMDKIKSGSLGPAQATVLLACLTSASCFDAFTAIQGSVQL